MATKKAPAKKTTVKKPVKKTTTTSARQPREKVVTTTPQAEASRESRKSFKLKRAYVLPVIGILLLAGLLYAFRSLFVAAMVNGQPISRVSLVRELEKQNGKQALNSLVTKTLIYQEARKQNVSVSDDEINGEMKKIEENLKQQGQRLDQVLALQGMTRDTLIEQIRIQKMIEKMVGKDIKVADKDIDAYIQENGESLPTDVDPKQLRTDVSERLRQEKLNEKVQSWLDNLQKNARINYFVNY